MFKSQLRSGIYSGGRSVDEGGFDVVVGNPPWGATFSENELEYLRVENDKIIVRMIDSFMFFVLLAVKKLKNKGYLGMIIPDVVLYQVDNFKLREKLLQECCLNKIINLGNGVFEGVNRPSCILTFQKKKEIGNFALVLDLTKQKEKTLISNQSGVIKIKQDFFGDLPEKMLITSNIKSYEILKRVYKLDNCTVLKEFIDEDGIQRGVSPDLKEAFIVDQNTIKENKLEKEYLFPVLTGGKHVKRYYIDYQNSHLIYTTRNTDYNLIPNICKYIDKFKEDITCVEVKKKKHSIYSLHRPRERSIFEKSEKFIGVITEDELII